MATWQPNPSGPIGDNEPLGRRIFDDAIWRDALAQGKTHIFRPDHFDDNRLAEDLSFDRLGMSGNPQAKVLRFLDALAQAEAENHGKDHAGWGWVLRKNLRDSDRTVLKVLPSPIIDDLDSPDNPYHADLSRENHRTVQQAKYLSLHLAHLFNKIGKLEPASKGDPKISK